MKLPVSLLALFAKQVWTMIVYPLLDKYVKSTTNVYDDKALSLLNDAILFVSDNLGVQSIRKLSK